jgi:leucyl-tRNA synthetase
VEKYNPQKIEPKWQKYWEKHPELYVAKDDSKKEKKYNLVMFPYPSGDGLHVGHVESYTATDIISRFDRMNGKEVMQPLGWDAFGLPAENYAIKTKIHPSKTTQSAIKNFKKQVSRMGMSYDWSREIDTSNPDYYKWTQWFFLLLYKNGLAYKAKAKVNWCDFCKTVLANEQAEGGICERCKNPVRQKDMDQWFFKITDFIEPSFAKASDGQETRTSGLLDGLDGVDWPGSTKQAQKNWIGKSTGSIVKFRIEKKSEFNSDSELNSDFLDVFTTRLDTIYGCTYCVVAPEHKLISNLTRLPARQEFQISNFSEVEKYLEKTKNKSDLERMEAKDKTGVELKGIKAVNPFTNEAVPIYVADYVLSQYGTGAVMAVPAHDTRDLEFAKKYHLSIKTVIEPCFLQLTEPGKIREGEPFKERRAILAIVKHWKDNAYLGLKWKQVDWQTLITGGVEEGQTAEAAARTEVMEETGYKNLRLIKQLPMAHSKFYHVPKKENRFAHFHTFYFELENGEKDKILDKEKNIHEAVWVPKDKIEQFLTPASQKYAFQLLQKSDLVYTDDGILSDSGEYSGLSSQEAREKMIEWLEKNNLGEKKINYKIRDWLVSRQRYWGAPIPVIYCEKCGTVPVPEKDLPVELPTDVDFKPTGESPLKYSKKFQDVLCPVCGAKARRESDTMDTFVCSSWYYFRYADPKNEKAFAEPEKIKKWLPVDLYVGGAEHTVLHLLYSRFFTKALHHLGFLDFDEPFSKLRHQGIILSEDGRKMSKSLGNVVNPDLEVKKWGADSLRLFEMFMGPLEDAKPWNTKGIVGCYRFLEKVYKLHSRISANNKRIYTDKKFDSLIHKTIKKVTDDIESLRFNTAISALMILANEMEKEKEIQITNYGLLVTLLSPFAPFISEELWSKLNHKKSIFEEKWPKYDPKLIKDEEIELVIQINGKVRDKVIVRAEISEEEAKRLAAESEKIKTCLLEKKIKKIIFVKGRLINIVV